jgi:DNA-binding XRE family transcriptional regulator
MTRKVRNFKELSEPILADPQRRSRVDEMYKAMLDSIKLSELRERRLGSQRSAAAKLNTTQSRISQIERGDDLYLSTLGRYVTAMGGELKIVAEFPDETVTLTKSN